MEKCDLEQRRLRNTHMLYISSISSMLSQLEKQYGREISEVASAAYCDCAVDNLLRTATPSKDRTIKDLVKFLWEPLRDFGFDFTFEEKDNGTQITCLRCPWSDMFKAIGAEKWGYALQCKADHSLVEKFNPKIGFKRSKTLMEGDECCDHFYFIQK